MDMLRSLAKSKGKVLVNFENVIKSRLAASCDKAKSLSNSKNLLETIEKLLDELNVLMQVFRKGEVPQTISRARVLAFSIAEITIGKQIK